MRDASVNTSKLGLKVIDSQNLLQNLNLIDTVDGRNPAPVDR